MRSAMVIECGLKLVETRHDDEAKSRVLESLSKGELPRAAPSIVNFEPGVWLCFLPLPPLSLL